MAPRSRTIQIATAQGLARVHVHPAPNAVAALLLGHGAGGGIEAPDLVAATEAARELGITAILVEQPYRVAGRRAPAPIAHCERALVAVVEQLQTRATKDLTLVVGGRSMGARIACRAAEQVGAAGVLCLAFPLQPSARRGTQPSPDRLAELDAVSVPTLVVQGQRDPFGMPPASRGRRTVVQVAGDHDLKADIDAVRAAIAVWLAQFTT